MESIAKQQGGFGAQMTTSDLTETIARSIDGDLDAFALLVERFQDMAVGYAYSILGDFQLAEDAAQEAFIDAYRHIHQLREPKAFSSWLRRIVFNHCDRLIRKFKNALVPLDAAIDQVAKPPDPFEMAAMSETKTIVHQALAELPERNREVVALYYMSAYTQTDIAAYLEVSVDTVKRRLREGRALLQEGFLQALRDELRDHRPSRDETLKERVMEVIAGNKEQHSEQMYKILERSRRPGQYQWREGRIEHSHTDWNVSRIGTVKGEVIAAYGIFDISMRIGSATVRVGGNNWNATHPDFEDQEEEIFRRLEADSFAAMRAQGYDMAANFEAETRFGIPHTFGWREYIWTVATDDLPTQATDFELSECPSDHRKDLGDLYNRHAEGLTGTAVRPTFLRNKHPGVFTTWYWTDGGEPIGYVSGNHGARVSLDPSLENDLNQHQLSNRLKKAIEENRYGPVSDQTRCVPVEPNQWWIIDPILVDDWFGGGGRRIRMVAWKNENGLHLRPDLNPQFRVDEVAGDPEQILQVLGKLTRESGHQKVVFDRLHYQSPIAKRLRMLVETHISVRWPNYYLRILNLRSVFDKLAPELSRRLTNSLLKDWQGDLILSNGEEEVMLAIDRTEVRVVPVSETAHSIIGGLEIVQLIVGTDIPDEVVEMHGITLKGDAVHLIHILFPIQYPQMENQAM